MARGRMISKSLSTSERRARLHDVAEDLAEFCQALYPLLVAHSDDAGRQPGDAFTVKHAVDPTSPRTLKDFERALEHLADVRLIEVYQVDGRQLIQIDRFAEHQSGLKVRKRSAFPDPPKRSTVTALNASEAQVEDVIARYLTVKSLFLPGFTAVHVQQQVRVGNSYLDVVVDTLEGPKIVIEVKRQRVTAAAIQQVLRYRDLMPGAIVVPVVIGHGASLGLQVIDCGVLVGTYDDELRVRTVSALPWDGRELTLQHISERQITLSNVSESQSQENVNVTEEDTVTSTYGAGAPNAPQEISDKKPASTWKRAIAIAHVVIETFPKSSENWGPEVKGRMLEQHMNPRERSPRGGQMFDDAVAYAIEQRKDRKQRVG